MNQDELLLMEYFLSDLNKAYPEGYSIYDSAFDLKKEMGISFTDKEINIMEIKFIEYGFVENISNNCLGITFDTKQKVDHYGSLSEFFINEIHQMQKAKNRTTSKTIIPIIIQGLTLISAIVFGILTFIFDSDRKELRNEIIIKDSIIEDLRFQLNELDTFEIETNKIPPKNLKQNS